VTQDNVIKLTQPGTFSDPLTEILRNGARALLAHAVEDEVAGFLGDHADKLTADGRARLVRHGHLPEREIVTGIGPVAVRCPQVRDRAADGGERIRFSSVILPPYARRSKRSANPNPLPQGRLHRRLRRGARRVAWQGHRWALGLDHREAQGGLVGRARALEQARPLGQTLRLLLGRWHPRAGPARRPGPVPAGHHRRHTRRQEGTRRSHRWRARERTILEGAAPRPQAARTIDGSRAGGRRWRARLWQALEEVWPNTRGQRCSVHKTTNVLNKLPKSQQFKAKRALQEVWMAETKEDALAAFDAFIETWGVKYDKAVECLIC
jgi:putative transposase